MEEGLEMSPDEKVCGPDCVCTQVPPVQEWTGAVLRVDDTHARAVCRKCDGLDMLVEGATYSEAAKLASRALTDHFRAGHVKPSAPVPSGFPQEGH